MDMNAKSEASHVKSPSWPVRQLTKKYDILSIIGEGSHGRVFKGQSFENPQTYVAIKKLLLKSSSEGFPLGAIREIKALNLLKHKNVVNLIEVCISDLAQEYRYRSFIYLVFEFCDHDLCGLLNDSGIKFNAGEIKLLTKMLFEGLQFIHNNNFLHRDLKPSNILITNLGVLKIADFSLARITNDKIKSEGRLTNRVVTLIYRSPELLLGAKNYGPTIDTWSAACIVVEMQLRRPLMDGNTEVALLNLISHLCGSITPKVWPSVVKLSMFHEIMLLQNQRRRVKESLLLIFKEEYICDLLDKLFVLDPEKRFTSNDVLGHEYFFRDPKPRSIAAKLARCTENKFCRFNSKELHSNSNS